MDSVLRGQPHHLQSTTMGKPETDTDCNDQIPILTTEVQKHDPTQGIVVCWGDVKMGTIRAKSMRSLVKRSPVSCPIFDVQDSDTGWENSHR